jgi:hypothetical protein
MWQHDFKNYSEEERRLHDKINKINRDNQEFLRKQMEEKSGKQVKAKTEQTGIPIEQTFIEGDQ